MVIMRTNILLLFALTTCTRYAHGMYIGYMVAIQRPNKGNTMLSQNAQSQIEKGYDNAAAVIPDRSHTIYHVIAAACARWGLEDVKDVLRESSTLLENIEDNDQ